MVPFPPQLKELILKAMVEVDYFKKPGQAPNVLDRVDKKTNTGTTRKQMNDFIHTVKKSLKMGIPVKYLVGNVHYEKLKRSYKKYASVSGSSTPGPVKCAARSRPMKTPGAPASTPTTMSQAVAVKRADEKIEEYIAKQFEEKLKKAVQEVLPKLVEEKIAAILPTLHLQKDISTTGSSCVSTVDLDELQMGDDDDMRVTGLTSEEAVTKKINAIFDMTYSTQTMIVNLSEKMEQQEAIRKGEQPMIYENELSAPFVKEE